MTKKAFCIIAFIFLGFCCTEAKTVNRIVVQVNDEIITLFELNQRIEEIRKALEARYSKEQVDQIMQKEEKQALDNLIEEKLLNQKADEMGYGADVDSQVTSYIQGIMKENNIKDTEELENALSQQGLNLKDYRDEVRKRIMRDSLVNDFVRSHISLLTPEIEKYYKDHIEDFTSPEEVTLSEIIIREGDNKESENRVNDLYKRLQKGESFANLASQYSKGPTANKGGNIGTYIISKLNPETVKYIENLKEGEISKPHETREGWVIYHIDGRKPAATAPLDEVKNQIRAQIFQQKFEPEYRRFITQLREDAYINYPSEIK